MLTRICGLRGGYDRAGHLFFGGLPGRASNIHVLSLSEKMAGEVNHRMAEAPEKAAKGSGKNREGRPSGKEGKEVNAF